MLELKQDQIAEIVAQGIHEPMRMLFEAVERKETDLNSERQLFENALVSAVAKAIFEASQNGVTKHNPGLSREFMSQTDLPNTAIARENNSHDELP